MACLQTDLSSVCQQNVCRIMKLPSVINHRTSVASSTAVILSSSLYNVGHLQVSVPLRSALLVSTSQYQSIGSSHVAIFQHRYRSKSKARLANHNRMPIVVVHEQLTSSFLEFSYKYLKTLHFISETNSFLLPVKQSQNTTDQTKTHESMQFTSDE